MDKAETIIAKKRVERWPATWKADVVELTPQEREVLLTLVALTNARPADGQERA